jgi:acyl-coenzyme A synthetase/AMP-(fatty) acid ligase
MPGRRRYYSGDLGSLSPDGCLHYKGRKDSRTKIRGIGVETTQLEAALHRHPHVQDAVAVVNEDESGERQIAVYVVPQDGAVLTVRNCENFCRIYCRLT